MDNKQSDKIDVANELLDTSFESIVEIETFNDMTKKKYRIDSIFKYSFLELDITNTSYIVIDNHKTEKIVLFINEINYINASIKLYAKYLEPQIFINNSQIQENKTETMMWLYGKEKKDSFNKKDINKYILLIWVMDNVKVSLYKANTVFNKNNSVMVVINSIGNGSNRHFFDLWNLKNCISIL